MNINLYIKIICAAICTIISGTSILIASTYKRDKEPLEAIWWIGCAILFAIFIKPW